MQTQKTQQVHTIHDSSIPMARKISVKEIRVVSLLVCALIGFFASSCWGIANGTHGHHGVTVPVLVVLVFQPYNCFRWKKRLRQLGLKFLLNQNFGSSGSHQHGTGQAKRTRSFIAATGDGEAQKGQFENRKKTTRLTRQQKCLIWRCLKIRQPSQQAKSTLYLIFQKSHLMVCACMCNVLPCLFIPSQWLLGISFPFVTKSYEYLESAQISLICCLLTSL